MSEHIPVEDLSARIDEELAPARRDQVDAHLAGCEACHAEMESLRWASDFGNALPPAPTPDDLHLSLPAGEHHGRAEPEGSFSFGRWAGLAAVAALLILSFGLGRLMDGRPGSDSAGESEVADMAVFESEAGEAMDVADPDALDIDSAVRRAQERAEPLLDPEPMLQPLATALTDERAETGSQGAAAPRAASSAEAATATSAAADAGGYRPPDLQIPGAPSARDLPAPVAGTASAITAARATASAALALLEPIELPSESGGSGPQSEATRDAARAMQPGATLEAAGTAMAELGSSVAMPDLVAEDDRVSTRTAADSIAARRATATAEPTRHEPPSSGNSADHQTASEPPGDVASEAMADASMDETAEVSDAPPPSAGTSMDSETASLSPSDPTDPALAPRSLLVPLLALSVGLLALGTLLLRQARRARRRRRHLER